jgi:trk system potassium uptake protein TrkA
MKLIINGIGPISIKIAKYLADNDSINVTVVDKNTNLIRTVTDKESIAGIAGNITSIKFTKSINLDSADMYISITENDEENILSCMLAKSLNVPIVMPYINKKYYLDIDSLDVLSKSFNIDTDSILSSSNQIVKLIASKLLYNTSYRIIDVMSLLDDKAKCLSLYCKEESYLNGRKISEIEEIFQEINIQIVGLIRNNDFFIPNDETFLKENDKIFFIVNNDNLERSVRLFSDLDLEDSIYATDKPNVTIIGDSELTLNLAIELQKEGYKVTVYTDNDYMSEYYAYNLEKYSIPVNNLSVLNESISKNHILQKTTVVLLTHQKDEDNIMIALSLKFNHLENIYCFLNNSNYEDFLLHYGINNLIILDTVIISTILNKLRKGLIFSLNVLNSKAELVELEVSNKSLSIGKTVEYLEKNYPIKLGIILRNNDEIKKITKDLVIQEGDRVVYIGSKNNIEIAEKIFIQSMKELI